MIYVILCVVGIVVIGILFLALWWRALCEEKETWSSWEGR